MEAPSILSSGPVAAGGQRTTRYGGDGREGPVYQGYGGRSGRSRTTKDNRECRVMAPRAGFEPATNRLTAEFPGVAARRIPLRNSVHRAVMACKSLTIVLHGVASPSPRTHPICCHHAPKQQGPSTTLPP